MDALPILKSIFSAITSIAGAGIGGAVGVGIGIIALIAAFFGVKAYLKKKAKAESDAIANRDQASNPNSNRKIEHDFNDAEDLVKKAREERKRELSK